MERYRSNNEPSSAIHTVNSPTDTEPDRATWEFWPNAPPGDFARLVPESEDARLAFQAVVTRMLAEPQSEPWPFASQFIHWEPASHDDSESKARFESTPETGSSIDLEQPTPSQQPLSSLLPYTGYYRLNMLDPHPRTNWVLGAGRKNKNVEFILTTLDRKALDRISGRHARLERSLDSGTVIVVTDNRPVTVDGYHLSRRGEKGEQPVTHQRAAGSKSSITLGRLVYHLQIVDLSPEVDMARAKAAAEALGSSGPLPSFFLTPTPSMTGTLMGEYRVFEPFAAGSGGTVQYVTHTVSGKAYALKRMKQQFDSDRRAIRNEIDLLRSVSHPHACRFVEEFTQQFERPDIRKTDGFAEVCFVLEPPARHSLKEFVSFDQVEEVNTTSGSTAARQHFLETVLLQLADVGAYLHTLGIMHRDYKLDNVGVVRVSPKVEVVLLDFGHAIRARESEDHMKGTVRYLAPEVLALKKERSRKSYNCAVDVWALGVMMMELDMQRQVEDENIAQQWASELQQRPRSSGYTRVQMLLPRLLCADAGKRITMPQIVEALGQRVNSAGKRNAGGGDEPANRQERYFNRQITLSSPEK
ncbi:hypothetical protein LTR82_017953 [Friedmanniomyces endolithicus]|uniref:Protein kinase domain-containing protein n=1 Tax=Friedmanniomyces endolithicus TaxID=329885 RepID=A0AAN6J0B2_9PEZI|nr:hypothetical protein LTR82_017953 [Friedmanniomyces endolithicus]